MTAKSAGERLSDAIHAALAPGTELDEREQALLDAAAAQADDLSALEADIGAGVDACSRTVVNSSVREARPGELTLTRLLSGIDLPTPRPSPSCALAGPLKRAGRRHRDAPQEVAPAEVDPAA